MCFDVATVPPAYVQYLQFATNPVLKAHGFRPETPREVELYAKNVWETLQSPALVARLARDIQACGAGDPVDNDVINALETYAPCNCLIR